MFDTTGENGHGALRFSLNIEPTRSTTEIEMFCGLSKLPLLTLSGSLN